MFRQGVVTEQRYDPEVYIKTKSGSLFAIIKMFEAAAAGIGLFAFVLFHGMIVLIAQNLLTRFEPLIRIIFPDYAVRLLTTSFRLPAILIVVILLLVVLDGIGVMIIRYGQSGEGLVSFVHLIRWIANIIRILLVIISLLRCVVFFRNAGNLVHGDNGAEKSLAAPGTYVLVCLIVRLVYLIFFCNYHKDIRIILDTVHEERQILLPVRAERQHLAGRCLLITWNAGTYLLFSLLFLVLSIVMGRDLIPESSLREISIAVSPLVLLTVNFLVALLRFLKFIAMRNCVKSFNKAHKNNRRR